MKAILLLLSGLVLAVTVFLSGVAATAYLIAEPAPHRFSNVDHPDLWTSTPVVVSSGDQRYERIAAVTAKIDLPASDAQGQPVAVQDQAADAVDGVQTASLDEADQASVDPVSDASVNQAHADWCFARYRSYRLEDNTYQPYRGGQRRACQSPVAMSHGQDNIVSGNEDTGIEEQGLVQQVSATSTMIGRGQDGRLVRETDRSSSPQNASYDATSMGNPAHEEWCLSRYRSYRANDNSYTSYGGMRRTCQSPYG